jgi:phosphoglycolate phosphatase
MRAIDTVFFDLDGTLADTAPDLAYALNTVLQENGFDPLAYESIRHHVSQGGSALIRLGFGSDLEEANFTRLRIRFLEIYRANLCVQTRLFPGMHTILDYIEQYGMKWGVVTNKPAWLTDPLIRALALDQRAACIISGDTTNQKKPHPRPLLYACELVNCPPQLGLYVGDDPRDIQAGKAAGLTTLVARYGYIHQDHSPEQWGADGIIETVTDLLNWLPTCSFVE